jgi:lambda family phage tail tape measure protein
MASLKYTVDVDTRGARSSISSLEKSLGGLGAAVAGGFAIGNIVAFGDSIIGLQNKLRSLTGDQALVGSMFNDITRIAGAARAPLQETGDLYFRIARAAKDLGISQQQTSDITESLAKSMSMTGATAQETSGALLQLGQALQSGRFQGDELRSVLENMPIVSKAMADELGVTIGELRKLGSEGKITSDVFVRAMEKNKKAIDDAFARSVPTAMQALNNLKTAFAVAMTEMAQEEGTPAAALAGLGEAILSLAKDIPALVEAIKSLVTILGLLGVAFAAFKGIALIRVGLNALSKAFIAASVSSTGFFTMFKSNATGIVRSMKAIVTGTGQITAGVKAAGGTVTFLVRLRQAFFSIAAIAGNVLRILLRFAGWVGIALAVAEAVDFLVKKFFGFSIVDWAWQKVSALWSKLKEFAAWIGLTDKASGRNKQGGGREAVGGPNRAVTDAFDASRTRKKNDVFGDASTKVTPKDDSAKEKADEAKKKAEEQAKALRDVRDAILEVTKAFRESTAARLADLDFQYKSLGMSEDQIELESQRRDIIREQSAAIADLDAKQKEIQQNEDLSKKGKEEALALLAKERIAIDETTAATLAASEAKLKLIQAETIAREKNLAVIELENLAASNKVVLQNLEDQLQLVGLYGDNLENVTAQLELQQKLREIELDYQTKLRDLDAERLKIGEARYANQLANLQALTTEQKAAAKAQADAQKKLVDLKREAERNDIGGAIGKRLEELERSVDPAVTAVEGLNSLFSNMGTALDNFVDTGKLKFGDFAKSVIADIAKIALKAAVTKLFTLVGKSILGLAAGGPVMANKPYVVGEQGPELFVPNSAGSIMTNASMNKNAGADSGMGATVTNNYITNNISAIDSRSVAQMFVENRKSLLGASMMARKELPYGG